MQFTEMQSTESALLQGGTSVVMTAFLYEVIADMLPFLIVAVIVILVDLIFGIRAAQLGEKVGVDLSDVKITFDDIEDDTQRDN